jgi:hypothetical protein
VLNCTVSVVGAVVVFNEALSQPPLFAVALKPLSVPPPVSVTDTFCALGFAPPTKAGKLRIAGDRPMVGELDGVIVTVTPRVGGLPPATVDATLIVAV